MKNANFTMGHRRSREEREGSRVRFYLCERISETRYPLLAVMLMSIILHVAISVRNVNRTFSAPNVLLFSATDLPIRCVSLLPSEQAGRSRLSASVTCRFSVSVFSGKQFSRFVVPKPLPSRDAFSLHSPHLSVDEHRATANEGVHASCELPGDFRKIPPRDRRCR